MCTLTFLSGIWDNLQSVLPPGQGEILSLSRDYCSKLTLIPGYQMPLFFPGQNIDLKQSADHFFSNIQFIHHQQIMALQSYQVLVPVPEGFPWWLSWQRIHLQCRRLPAMQLTQVRSLSREDTLEKEMATHSSILAWKIHWTEESGRLQSIGSQELDMTYWQNHQGLKNIFMEGRKEVLKGSSNSSPQLRSLPRDSDVSLSEPQHGNFLKIITWKNHRARVVWFPSLSHHCQLFLTSSIMQRIILYYIQAYLIIFTKTYISIFIAALFKIQILGNNKKIS